MLGEYLTGALSARPPILFLWFGLRCGGKTNLRVKCQAPREIGFARALTAQHPDTRSDRSTGVCRENGVLK